MISSPKGPEKADGQFLAMAQEIGREEEEEVAFPFLVNDVCQTS